MNASSTPDPAASGPDEAAAARANPPATPRPRWQRVTIAAVTGVLDLVFPPACVSCHGKIEPAPEDEAEEAATPPRYLCPGCRRRILLVRAPHCTTCGHPFFGEMAENIGCAHCETLHPQFGAGRTATLLQGPMRDLVHAFKYRGARHVLRDITALVQANDHFRAFLDGARLVPVPLHPRKERERGFNQARILADIFAGQARGATVQPLLRRVVDTPTQTRLDREQRRDNLKNAFALAPRASLEPAIRHVLVDDVFTTGATLNACAAVLRRAGMTTIDVATLGHG